MQTGKEVVRLKKERNTEQEKVTRAEQSNYWRGVREDKAMEQKQQGISIKNPYIVKTEKPFIPDKYKNRMELKKPKRKK